MIAKLIMRRVTLITPILGVICHQNRGDWKCGSRKCDTVKIARAENAGVEIAGVDHTAGKMQEWKKQEQIAGVENAGVSRMEHQTEIIWKEP